MEGCATDEGHEHASTAELQHAAARAPGLRAGTAVLFKKPDFNKWYEGTIVEATNQKGFILNGDAIIDGDGVTQGFGRSYNTVCKIDYSYEPSFHVEYHYCVQLPVRPKTARQIIKNVPMSCLRSPLGHDASEEGIAGEGRSWSLEEAFEKACFEEAFERVSSQVSSSGEPISLRLVVEGLGEEVRCEVFEHDKVRTAINAAVAGELSQVGLRVLFGGELIHGGTFHDNGIDDGARLEVFGESPSVSYEEAIEALLAANTHLSRALLRSSGSTNLDGSLKHLRLKSCGIETLPDCFVRLQLSGTLDLADNKLQTLPEAFGENKNRWQARPEKQ